MPKESGQPKAPVKRKPLFAGPARLLGRRLVRRRRGKGYSPSALDIVERNVCDGFEVFCTDPEDVAVLRAYRPLAGRAGDRDQLLGTWPKVPERLEPLLRQTFDLAAREFRWKEPEDAAGYVRSTSAAIERFLERRAPPHGPAAAP
jgi:hypothetical protein